MTGYGSAKGNAAGFEVSIEIKSVNNRNLETSVRLPRSFLFAESAVKIRLQGILRAGRLMSLFQSARERRMTSALPSTSRC